MRYAAVATAVVLALLMGRFVWDDIVSADDIPRGVTVSGVAIGNTDRATASERLQDGLRLDTPATLTFDNASETRTLTDWGLVVDIEATLDRAEDARGGGPIRFLRWTAAVIRDREVEPAWTVDPDVLATAFATNGLDLAVTDAPIALADGQFVSAGARSVPTVDLDRLGMALLDALGSDGSIEIAVPTGATRSIGGSDSLALAANVLTDRPLTLRMAGQLETTEIDIDTIRGWVDATDAETADQLRLHPERVRASLVELLPTPATDGLDGVEFVIGFDGKPYALGALDGTACCAPDTADRLLEALRNPRSEPLVIFPDEPADARGLAWAESLGITELVGEFTTNYTANQTRNINIARISELTRGTVIQPGGTFSINDEVGRRTTENGFVAAGVIANGVFSESVGGGISQYATTVFNAAFFAGLDFGEYQSHSIYISRYPYGREATVSFPAPDLQIRNTTPHGVLLWPTTDANSITVRLYSTAWVTGEQTGQTERTEGVSCTRVTTERTRTWVDGRTEVDSVTARYRPEGIRCDGSSTVPTTSTTTTTTTAAPPTTVPTSTTTTTTLPPPPTTEGTTTTTTTTATTTSTTTLPTPE